MSQRIVSLCSFWEMCVRSFDDQKFPSTTMFDSSRCFLCDGAACVANEWLVRCQQLFVLFSLSPPRLSCTSLEKFKEVIQFFIPSNLIHVFLLLFILFEIIYNFRLLSIFFVRYNSRSFYYYLFYLR
jgi:hypothetical protein